MAKNTGSFLSYAPFYDTLRVLFPWGGVIHIVGKAIRKYLLVAYATIAIDVLISYSSAQETIPSVTDWISTLLLVGGLWKNTPIWFLFTLVLCQILLALCVKISPKILLAVAFAFVCVDCFFVRPFAW